MGENILIGFLGGLITGISPCILPVLPVIFFSGGLDSARRGAPSSREASRWRPYQVIAGLVLSFSAVTLLGSLALSALGLPQDVLRWAGIAVLAAVGTGLMVPKVEEWLEKPFSWIPQRRVDARRGGFGLGIALGAVFVPCAGPVLAAIVVSGATGRIGPESVALTLSFAAGVAVPLLVFALAGRGLAERLKAFRHRQRGIRITAGVLMIALAAGLALDLPAALQRLLPDYTASLQDRLRPHAGTPLDLGGLVTDENRQLANCTQGATGLQDCGPAPALRGATAWIGSDPLTLADLRGRVVLIDFWAYSCINCQRSLPHIVALNDAYKADGLTVIGVHTPEYAFEREQRNVEAGIKDHGIDYPVVMDNAYSTWSAYRNRFWPAQYLIDAAGNVRHIQQGEGGYQTTEALVRQLLADAHPGLALPAPVETAGSAPAAGTTPETFLGVAKQVNYAGVGSYRSGAGTFSYPAQQPADSFALSGPWTLGAQSITAGAAASVRLNFRAAQVQAVAEGTGTLTVRGPDGEKTVHVGGTPRSYVLLEGATQPSGTLEITASPGVVLYSFTFG
ncbi:protein DipZ [Sinomonas cyclohexanicum]|uniref:Protein DipZ n=1 Tax=Sinomonas cyclohexanicum TaxID=322009 RepID=A0ABN6FLJ1_SINCY|nr:cytochrome c biogenesis protein CcdA [Corynebacterium cyclohexanicum]BCT77676.1 protein DipZ [Corynebacterium cyclohexanicum]